MSVLKALDQKTKTMLGALKRELTAQVGSVAKDAVSANECSCSGCEGCGYNCAGNAAPGWFAPTLHVRTLAL